MPLHAAAGRAARLLAGATSFREFEARVQDLDDNDEKGDVFEAFIEGYLNACCSTEYVDVWPEGAVPARVRKELHLPAKDMGVDGVARTSSGELHALQMKFRTGRNALAWSEISTFVGSAKNAKQHVLFTNSLRARDPDGMMLKVTGVDLDDLDARQLTQIRAFALGTPKRRALPKPRRHQARAIAAITAELKQRDRAQAVLACGTGKTLIALWVLEALLGKRGRGLVLAPSLAVLDQTIKEFSRATSWDRMPRICVCSDQSVGRGRDEVALRQSELSYRVSTDPKDVTEFLDLKLARSIVFSTYHSAPLLAEALRGRSFDVAVFDEAHRTASRRSTNFAFALFDENVAARKRLFLTATPRIFSLARTKDGEATLVSSMDDQEVYGRRAFELSFAKAAAPKNRIICPYKVVISVVTADEVDAWRLEHGEVIVDGEVLPASHVAKQIALRKAVEKTGARKIISFHGRVKEAKAFVGESAWGIGRHLPGFDLFHANGRQPASVRRQELRDFRESRRALISNAACLTEGVDVPAVDMVAFTSPKRSKIDIVQAAGRAMRRAGPEKDFGYILIPVFLESERGESVDEAVGRTGFEDVWHVLRALMDQDEALVQVVSELRRQKGELGSASNRGLREHVEFLAPELLAEQLESAVVVSILERLGSPWYERYGLVRRYVEDFGDSAVPMACEYGGVALGRWVVKQRQLEQRGKLLPERKALLEELPGWVWNTHEDAWDRGHRVLLSWVMEHGHADVPAGTWHQDYRLGQWVNVQRTRRKNEVLEPHRVAKLASVPGWVWDSIEAAWEKAYDAAKSFAEEHGHLRPAPGTRYQDVGLATWLTHQRSARKKKTLRPDQVLRLEQLPGWSWDIADDRWNRNFRLLSEYWREHGGAPARTEELPNTGVRLGNWVKVQRRAHRAATLSSDRQAQLESLEGWAWERDPWEEGFEQLLGYVEREGHALVPAKYCEGDYPLGNWVSIQRSWNKKGKLLPERVRRLNAVPGWVWDVKEATLEWNYRLLCEYVEEVGDANLPAKTVFKTVNLGMWITNLRVKYRKGKLAPHFAAKLERLPGWVWRARG